MKLFVEPGRRIFLKNTESRNCCMFWSFHLCLRLACEKDNDSYSYTVWPDSIDKYDDFLGGWGWVLNTGHSGVKIDPSIIGGKK